jgi:hypothetical protein|tara:strand:- start:862 stop:1098 length:237 start_codon:yes stop_codon:yes gene_type:complete
MKSYSSLEEIDLDKIESENSNSIDIDRISPASSISDIDLKKEKKCMKFIVTCFLIFCLASLALFITIMLINMLLKMEG